MSGVTTVIHGPRPPEVEALIQRRHALGQDLLDEIWEGTYHMVPGPHPRHANVQGQVLTLLREPAERAGLVLLGGPFNLGEPDDFRVPDGGIVVPPVDATFLPTACVVVEVLSPDDETYTKFGFYARHEVDCIVVADPETRTIQVFERAGDHYLERPEIPQITSARFLQDMTRWP
jgi:Uma2 family endonuclease